MKKLFIVTGFFFVISSSLAMADIPVQNTDAEVLGVISVIDQNEIQAAQLAEQKNINHKILDYARTLDVENNRHLDMDRQLSQELGLTIENDGSLEELRDQGTQDLAALTALDANEFAQLYIADVIRGNAEVLQWLSMQDVHNEHVKEFLNETQNFLSTQFKKARNIEEHQEQVGAHGS